jgi:hypothetical protein
MVICADCSKSEHSPEREADEIVKTALAIDANVGANVKQRLVQWAKEVVHHIRLLSKDPDRPLAPKAAELLRTLATRVARFRLALIGGDMENANIAAALIKELADDIVKNHGVAPSAVREIIGLAVKKINDPDPDARGVRR